MRALVGKDPALCVCYQKPAAPQTSFFLFGPRATGKTTWLRQHLPDALSVNLLEPEVAREMAARPERLRELVLGNLDRRDIVIDEVQRAPDLQHVVHALIEPNGNFVSCR